MMYQIASKVPQISKNFQKGRGTTSPLTPLPQDSNPKQGSAPQSRTASYAYEVQYVMGKKILGLGNAGYLVLPVKG